MRCRNWASALMILLVSGFCTAALGATGSTFAMPTGPGHSFMFHPQTPFHHFDHRGSFHSFHHGDRFEHHRHLSVLLIGVPVFWPLDDDDWPMHQADVSQDGVSTNWQQVLYYCYDPVGYYPAVMDCPSGWYPVVVGSPR